MLSRVVVLLLLIKLISVSVGFVVADRGWTSVSWDPMIQQRINIKPLPFFLSLLSLSFFSFPLLTDFDGNSAWHLNTLLLQFLEGRICMERKFPSVLISAHWRWYIYFYLYIYIYYNINIYVIKIQDKDEDTLQPVRTEIIATYNNVLLFGTVFIFFFIFAIYLFNYRNKHIVCPIKFHISGRE